MKIIEYKMLFGETLTELNSSVNCYLRDGWELYGSHLVNSDTYYCRL